MAFSSLRYNLHLTRSKLLSNQYEIGIYTEHGCHVRCRDTLSFDQVIKPMRTTDSLPIRQGATLAISYRATL